MTENTEAMKTDIDSKESSDLIVKEKKKKKEMKMTEEEKSANRKILKNMQKKQNYHKNKRFALMLGKKCLLYSNTLFKDIKNPDNPFVVDPPIVIFRNYLLNCIYQIDLKLINRTQLLCNFHHIPPVSENFTIKRIIYPKKDSSLIAPGMCARIEILFNATSLNNFDDELTIICEQFAFKVALKGIRDEPALALQNPLNCNSCLVGDQSSMVFRCLNNGGDAHFKFFAPGQKSDDIIDMREQLESPKDSQKGTDSNNVNIDNEVLTIGSFSIFPKEFYLYKGMGLDIFANFCPTKEGLDEQDLYLSCDSKINLPFKIKGVGTLIDIKLVELDGNPIDESELKLENIFFGKAFPFSSTTKLLKIKNFSPCEVKYHWNIFEGDFENKFNLSQEEEFFSITPQDGHFQPDQELTFELKFSPKNALIYEQKIEMIVEDVPFQAIKELDNQQLLDITNDHHPHHYKSEPFMLALNSPYPSYPLFTFNLVGSGNLCRTFLNPGIIDFGDVYLYQKKRKTFTVANTETNILTFRLREIMQVLHIKGENTINPYFKEYLETRLCNRQVISNNKKIIDGDLQNEMRLELGLLDNNNSQSNVHNILDVKIIDSLYDRYDKDSNNNKVNFIKLSTKNLTKSSSKIEKPKKGKKFGGLHALKKETQSVASFAMSNNGKANAVNANNATFANPNASLKDLNSSKVDDMKNSITLTQGTSIEDEVEENTKFTLKLNETIDFNVSFTPNMLGAFKSSLVFNVVDGIPFSVEIKANVIGPSVTVDIPFINFGLTSISEIKRLSFKIKNTSQIPFRFLVKESRFKNITLNNYLETSYVEDVEGEITQPIFKPKINNFLDFNDAHTFDIMRKYQYDLKFSKVTEVLQPEQEISILVSFVSPFPVLYEEVIEVMIENSESTFINAYADVQEAIAYLNLVEVRPKNIYVNVPITYESNIVTIVNPSNISISFSWKNIFSNDDVVAEFYPSIGTVPPKSSLDITYKVVYFRIREVDDLFICNIKEFDLPLGFVLKGKVTGLDIIYELTDESYHFMNSKHETQSVISSIGSLMSGDNRNRDRRSRVTSKATEIDKTLKMIEFKNLKVNKFQTFTFVIKNESGIHTHFNLKCTKYLPGKEKNLRSEMMRKLEETDTKSTNSNKRSKKSDKAIPTHSILNDEHEKFNFSSAKGKEFTKQRQIENDSILYLSNKKGVAIVVSPDFGQLEPHTEQMVTISVFNECVGDFEDELICDVKGLATKKFPIYIKIRGNPLQLSPFQPGIEYLADPPLLKMGHVLTRSNILEKSFKLLNTSANPLTVEWRIYDYRDILNPDNRNVFRIKMEEKKTTNSSVFKLLYDPVEPREFAIQHFSVEPKLATVQSKALKDFRITFKTDEPGTKSALIVAYPKFDDASTSNIKLSELTLKIDAAGVTPHIVVDKNRNVEGVVEYKFTSHSYGISPKPKRSIVFINHEKISLKVRLAVDGPFKIVNVEPKHSVISEMVYNIMPNTNLTVDVKFISPAVTDENDWPMTLLNEKYGKFYLTFENGEYQEFYLKGVLKRPRIRLSTVSNECDENTNFIDFGNVNVESFKKASIYLQNETEVDTRWKINYVKVNLKKVYGHKTMTIDEKEDREKVDDPDVFNFKISEGIISGPSLQLNNIPLGPGLPQIHDPTLEKYNPVKIDIIFKPKKKVFYKCLFRITSETGNSQDFILKGSGSYLEEFL